MRMNKKLQGYIIGLISSTIIMVMVPSFAKDTVKTIEVVFNKINFTVNGKQMRVDNLLYDGTTYVPVRAMSEMLGYDVGWEESTNTVNIYDKASKIKKDSTLRIMDDKRTLVKIKNDLYDLNGGNILIDGNNEYYIDLSRAVNLISASNNDFDIIGQANNIVKGTLMPKNPEKYLAINHYQTTILGQAFREVCLFNMDKTRGYPIEDKDGIREGAIEYDGYIIIPLRKLMETLDIKYNIMVNETEGTLVFSIL